MRRRLPGVKLTPVGIGLACITCGVPVLLAGAMEIGVQKGFSRTFGEGWAAPSTPEDVRAVALERAEHGEHITNATVQDIIAETKNKQSNGQAARRRVDGRQRTLKALDRLRRQWPDGKAQELAGLLREFADSLDAP